jgi:hypothetical protein
MGFQPTESMHGIVEKHVKQESCFGTRWRWKP